MQDVEDKTRVLLKRWRGGTASDLGFTETGAKIQLAKMQKAEPDCDWRIGEHPYLADRFELLAYSREDGSVKFEVQRNAGHPWDPTRKGFDVMAISAETQTELASAVKSSEAKYWQAWIVGVHEESGKPVAVMFQPCGVTAPWHDAPGQPHPGCEPQETDEMSRPRMRM